MGKLVRYEFLGSWPQLVFFSLLCTVVIGIPLVIVYAMICTVKVEERLENPSELLESLKAAS